MRYTRAKYSSWHPTALRQFCIGTSMLLGTAVISAYFSWPDSWVFGCTGLGAAVLTGCLFVVLWPDSPYVTSRGEDPLILLAALFVAVWFAGPFELAGWFPLTVASSVGAADGLATLFFVLMYRGEPTTLVRSYGPHVPPSLDRPPAPWSIGEPQSDSLAMGTAVRRTLQRVVGDVFADDIIATYSSVRSEDRVLLRSRDHRRLAGLEAGPTHAAVYLWDRGRFRHDVDTATRDGPEGEAVLLQLALLAAAYLRGEGRLERRHIWPGSGDAFIVPVNGQLHEVHRDPTGDH